MGLFRMPVHPDTRFWLAFTFEGKTYMWTRLIQGYCESVNNLQYSTTNNPILKPVYQLMIVRPPEQRHRPTNQGCRNIGTK